MTERQVVQVANIFQGLEYGTPARHDPTGKTRFVVEAEETEDVGIIYFGPDIYPGSSVTDPNAALSVKAAAAHEISHLHRWQDQLELPIDVHRHLDEALTSLDAALRFNLGPNEVQQLIRDAVHRLQMHRSDLEA